MRGSGGGWEAGKNVVEKAGLSTIRIVWSREC
jgi:hypothetical protein